MARCLSVGLTDVGLEQTREAFPTASGYLRLFGYVAGDMPSSCR